jgi:hypothetical protein
MEWLKSLINFMWQLALGLYWLLQHLIDAWHSKPCSGKQFDFTINITQLYVGAGLVILNPF